MCVTIQVYHPCNHIRHLHSSCDAKYALSTLKQQDLVCPEPAFTTWQITSDLPCRKCCAVIYRYEKRLEIVQRLEAEGYSDRITPMDTLTKGDLHLWRPWKDNREHFRKTAVNGGYKGELGQGPWSLNSWEEGGGFVERYSFDPFLGGMGLYEKQGAKGLEAVIDTLKGYEVRVGEIAGGQEIGEVGEETKDKKKKKKKSKGKGKGKGKKAEKGGDEKA